MKGWWSVFFPSTVTCWFCTQPVSKLPFQSIWQEVCTHCKQEIRKIDVLGCSICGRIEIAEGSNPCSDCQLAADHLHNRSVAVYSEWTKQLMWRFKFKGLECLAEPLGRMMAENVRYCWGKKPFIITYVPLSAERVKQRGFNQAERLATVIGQQLHLPVIRMLCRDRFTEAQSHKRRAERINSLAGAFSLHDQVDLLKWLGRPVLIVDDIYTTGTTLRECAKPLRRMNFDEVFATTFAR